MNAVQEMRPVRRVSKVELFDGGIRVTLSDGVGIRITYTDGKIMLLDDQYYNSHEQFHEVELSEVA